MTPHELLGLSIKRLQDQHHRNLDARLHGIELSLTQWHALREIERHSGSSQLRLAELTFNSAQAFGTLMTRMESAGLVKRKAGEGRAFAVTLTAKGARQLQEGRKIVLAVLAESFDVLTEDECRAMQRMVDKLLRVG